MRTRRPRTPWQALRPLAALTAIALLAVLAAPIAAQELQFVDIGATSEVKGAPTTEGKSAPAGQDRLLRPFTHSADAPLGQGFVAEVEPNGTFGEATPLGGSNVVARGSVFPNADLDWYSFTANAGDRVYAAVMTSFSSSGSTDSQLRVFAADGTTLIEFDEDDGAWVGFLRRSAAPSCRSGRHLLPAGEPFQRHQSVAALRAAFPPAEWRADARGRAERHPCDRHPAAGQRLGQRHARPRGGHRAGLVQLHAQRRATRCSSASTSTPSATTSWNGRLGLGLFGDAGNQILVVDDSGTVGAIHSEAFF